MMLDIQAGGRVVYERGVHNDFFVLVLDGCLEIRAGQWGMLDGMRRDVACRGMLCMSCVMM